MNGVLWRHYYVTDLCQRSCQQGKHMALITTQQWVHSVRQGCTATVKENGGHTIYWFCDFRNLGTCACGVVIGANDHRMKFRFVHTRNIAKWSTLLNQNNWIKYLHSFGINRHKWKADVCFLGPYICSWTYNVLPLESKQHGFEMSQYGFGIQIGIFIYTLIPIQSTKGNEVRIFRRMFFY